MASQASSAIAMPPVWQPESAPANLWLVPTHPATAEQGTSQLRPLEVAECTMCGVSRPLGLLIPDGGETCADVRWYCKDAQSCTERWTASLPRHAHIAPTPVSLAPPPAPMPMAIPASDPVPAELLSAPEEAWSIDPS